jgi:hypothetical protein
MRTYPPAITETTRGKMHAMRDAIISTLIPTQELIATFMDVIASGDVPVEPMEKGFGQGISARQH